MCLSSPSAPTPPPPTPPPPAPAPIVQTATPRTPSSTARKASKKRQGRSNLRIERKGPKTSASNSPGGGSGVNS